MIMNISIIYLANQAAVSEKNGVNGGRRDDDFCRNYDVHSTEVYNAS